MRSPKYRNTPTLVDGIKFASQKEARRYGVLKLLERAGKVHGLRLQVSYALCVNEVLVARYVADFVYTEAGRVVVEDVKGFRTPVYKLKRKLMWACHGIEIKEV